MASSYYGNGFAPLAISSAIKEKPVVDPNWEITEASSEQTSVFTEKAATRILSCVGYLEPRTISDLSGIKFEGKDAGTWGEVNQETKEVELKFYFRDVEIQRCYGIQVEYLALTGLDATKTPVVTRRATSELCADSIDNDLAQTLNFCAFSEERGGTLVFRERRTNITHTFTLFELNGSENGFYTFNEFMDLIVEKLRTKMNERFFPETIAVEFYIDISSGRLVLAWNHSDTLKSIIGHFELNIDPRVSTILKYIQDFFMFERFRKGVYNYETVSDGDGISWVRAVSNIAIRAGGGNIFSNTIHNTPVVIAVSPELSQFEKDDSITQYAGTGEICTLIPENFSQKNIQNHFSGSVQLGNLFAPKLPFDPNFSLTEFTVSLILSSENNSFLSFLKAVFPSGNAAVKIQDLVNRLNLVIIARLY